ncbi:MAG: RNA polymerase sigma factor [Bacteroidetes bacterium]|nr:RNA polymerase sigma factor [Bacteroidota bacterium]MBU1718516.1 RNA polymerase sigma factor [Bacteroidota bacterium]
MHSDYQLIQRCLKGDSVAQELLYRRFAAKMYGVCLRYTGKREDAQDVLQDGFIKVFGNLSAYKGDGSLEGWIRRIFINTAINHCNRNMFIFSELEKNEYAHFTPEDVLSELSVKELLVFVQELPEGYRIVFNLYAIEGYSHKEIAETLGISANTSKSQLSRARVALQEKIKKNLKYSVYEQTA